MLHIWHEDEYTGIGMAGNSATQQFWEFLKNNNVTSKLNNADIKGFNGVKNLYNHIVNQQCNINKKDTYIIFIDYAFDNPVTMRYYIAVKKYIKRYTNVVLVELLCFEYLMLTFKYLPIWVKPINDKNIKSYNSLCQLRNIFIDCIEKEEKWIENPSLCNFMINIKKINGSTNEEILLKLSKFTAEDVAYNLLSELTHRFSIGFKIEKTVFGDCWTCDCCRYPRGYPKYNKVKPCNIYRYKKNSKEKAENLFNCTKVKSIL